MKLGDLVRIIQGGKLVSPWLGERGIVIDEYEHRQCPQGGWFTVMISGELRHFNEGYLKVINESR